MLKSILVYFLGRQCKVQATWSEEIKFQIFSSFHVICLSTAAVKRGGAYIFGAFPSRNDGEGDNQRISGTATSPLSPSSSLSWTLALSSFFHFSFACFAPFLYVLVWFICHFSSITVEEENKEKSCNWRWLPVSSCIQDMLLCLDIFYCGKYTGCDKECELIECRSQRQPDHRGAGMLAAARSAKLSPVIPIRPLEMPLKMDILTEAKK